jgi:hypothetical protein
MSKNKTESEEIEIIKKMIHDYPNDYDLGKKIRDFFVSQGMLKEIQEKKLNKKGGNK